MPWLILGLVLFLGTHSTRMVADGWRTRCMARWGRQASRGLYALVSLIGFVLIVWGFGVARRHPVLLDLPAPSLRHLNAMFALAAFVLIAAAYVPRNHFRAWLGHPMLAGTAIWAIGHLLATGMVHDFVLFGAFLIWSAVGFVALRRRDHRTGVRPSVPTAAGTLLAVAGGAAAWALFAFVLHAWLIGVSPFA